MAFAAHFLHHVKENSVFLFSDYEEKIYRAETCVYLFSLYKYNTIHEKWIYGIYKTAQREEDYWSCGGGAVAD